MHFSIDRTVHTTAFDKPVVDHWLERKIAQSAAGSTEKDRSDILPLNLPWACIIFCIHYCILAICFTLINFNYFIVVKFILAFSVCVCMCI